MPHLPARPLATVVAALSCATVSLGAVLAPGEAGAQERPPLPDLTGIVKDEGWARVLGKALFWDTVASAAGSDCASCHFVTGTNRRIPDQSEAPLQVRRAATGAEAGPLWPDERNGIVDVCSRRINTQPAEIADFGSLRTAARVADEDPSCQQDLTVRLAHSLLEHQPLEARSINPNDGTFGPAGPHGNLVSQSGRGLDRTYQWMIQQAFEETLWKTGDGAVTASADPEASDSAPYPKVERNFPLFWGIAVMIYESTLDPRWTHDHQITREPASTTGPADGGPADWE